MENVQNGVAYMALERYHGPFLPSGAYKYTDTCLFTDYFLTLLLLVQMMAPGAQIPPILYTGASLNPGPGGDT